MKILWLTTQPLGQSTFSLCDDEISVISAGKSWASFPVEQIGPPATVESAHLILISDIDRKKMENLWGNRSRSDTQATLQWLPLQAGNLADLLVQAVGPGVAGYWLDPFAEGGVVVSPKTISAGRDKTLWELLIQQTKMTTDPLPQLKIEGLPANLPGLKPAKPGRTCSPAITLRELTDALPSSFSRTVPEWPALQAGLTLWFDEMDRSHQFSQSVEFEGQYRAGDYWHAILHRREPDDGNARYWFRHVGSHPIFPALLEQAIPLAAAARVTDIPCVNRLIRADRWDASAFVEVCSQARRSGDDCLTRFAEAVQGVEMILLLKQTLADCQ